MIGGETVMERDIIYIIIQIIVVYYFLSGR